MGRRPRLVLEGLVVVATALVAGVVMAVPSASDAGSAIVVRGMVDRTGAVVGDASGWHVSHRRPGVYEVTFAGRDPQVDVDRWDDVADVTVVPSGGGSDIVRFTNATGPVDTTFSFTAIVGP